MDRGAWWAKVHGVTKSQTRLSGQHFTAGLRALVCAHTVGVGPSSTAICDTMEMAPPAGVLVLRLLLRTRAGRGWYGENKVSCHQIRLVYPGLLRAVKFLMLMIR